ncbi:ABC transporter substrate-binding protein [Paenibacillus pinihumi]|uniref:ABC transporter substrate-binding protein n=1 Tax=Paenibacillus pinihumi TaxID=669462 RepID=UPI000409EED3|nr:extracellular solute-binding protein [Paenibacillus pinihumi]
MKRKRFIQSTLLAVLALIVIATTGCGSNGSASKGADENSGGDIGLTFGHFRVSKDNIDVLFGDTLNQFRADHPNIKIKEEAVAHDPYRDRTTTLGASGELPDIFMANGSMILDFASKGYVAPWDNVIKEDTAWSNDFVDGAFDDFKVDNQIYGVPVKMAAVHTIYYNKAIFKEIGINEFPSAWEDFKKAITTLKEAGYTPIGMGNRSSVPVGSTVFSTLADRVTGTNWFNEVKSGERKFTDPEFIQALEAMKELIDLQAFNPDINSIDEGQGEALFYNKEAAMHISGSWFLPRLVREAPEDIAANTGMAFFPAIEGGKGDAHAVAGGGGWSYAVNARLTGEKKEAAIELIKALSGEKFAVAQKEISEIPARNVANYDESKLSPLANEYSKMLEGISYTPVYDIRLKPALVKTIYQGVQELLIGASSPQQIAEKVQSAVE